MIERYTQSVRSVFDGTIVPGTRCKGRYSGYSLGSVYVPRVMGGYASMSGCLAGGLCL